MYEVGRLAIKIQGRDANKKCVIVDKIDDNFVLIDGLTRRKKCNIKHLEPLEQTIKISKGASHATVVAEFKKLGIEIKERKPKEKKPRQKKAKKKKAPKPVKEKKPEKKEEKAEKEPKPEAKPQPAKEKARKEQSSFVNKETSVPVKTEKDIKEEAIPTSEQKQ